MLQKSAKEVSAATRAAFAQGTHGSACLNRQGRAYSDTNVYAMDFAFCFCQI
jgi:hypothetical protein